MPLPYPPNCTLDIYRGFNKNDPYSVTNRPPDIPQVKGFLRPHVKNGRFGFNQRVYWTNLLYLDTGTDIRSGYNSFLTTISDTTADTVVISDYPIDMVDTAFYTMMVQRARSTPQGPVNFLKVYLDKAGKSRAVQQGCCDDVPHRLNVGIYDTSHGCDCLNGAYFPINYDSTLDQWSGSFADCNGMISTLRIKCDYPPGVLGFQMGLQCGSQQEIYGNNYFGLGGIAQCNPFHLQFRPIGNIGLCGPTCFLSGQTLFDITT
jgi:hypothetical protein